MRLLFATNGIFPDKVGGMERHAYFLIKHLAKFDIEIDVIEPIGSTEHFTGISNVNEFFIKRPDYHFPSHYLWEAYQYSRNISQFIKGKKYDVGYSEGFALLSHLRRKDFPCVFHPHGLEMFQTPIKYASIFRGFVSYMGKYSDITISLGGKLTDILENEAKIPNSKIEEVPNGIDLEYVKHLKKKSAKIPDSFLFVGRLTYNKGVDLLIKVFNELATYKLFIVGDGPQKKKLKKLTGNSSIDFLGRISEGELFDWYSKVECFIFPTRGEGMPTAVLEGMACGLPIIATDVGAISLLVSLKNGFLIKPGDKQKLKDVIKLFLSKSKRERRRMGEESRKLVEERFNWPEVAKSTYNLFERAVGR